MLFAMLQCFMLFVFLLTGNILLHFFILAIYSVILEIWKVFARSVH